MSRFIKLLLRYFLQGLFLIGPVGLTLYILYVSLVWLDSLLQIKDYPGLGIVILFFSVTTIGYLGSTYLAAPVMSIFERLLEKIPLVNLIYTSIKDLIGAFVGNKKKFNKPVVVTMNREIGLKRIGFITQNDLDNISIADYVAVYFPHSYNISGNLYLVPKGAVEPLNMSSPQVMKFVVSGGISWVQDDTAKIPDESTTG